MFSFIKTKFVVSKLVFVVRTVQWHIICNLIQCCSALASRIIDSRVRLSILINHAYNIIYAQTLYNKFYFKNHYGIFGSKKYIFFYWCRQIIVPKWSAQQAQNLSRNDSIILITPKLSPAYSLSNVLGVLQS